MTAVGTPERTVGNRDGMETDLANGEIVQAGRGAAQSRLLPGAALRTLDARLPGFPRLALRFTDDERATSNVGCLVQLFV